MIIVLLSRSSYGINVNGTSYYSIKSKKVDIVTVVNENDEIEYTSVYHYFIDDNEYTCSSKPSVNKPNGRNITLFYELRKPYNCKIELEEEAKSKMILTLLFFYSIPTIFLVITVFNFIKTSKLIKRLDYLNTYGVLLKNLPYYFKNHVAYYEGVRTVYVDYLANDGVIHTLPFNPLLIDGKQFLKNNTIDLVIDENDLSKYFIDFNINRIGGNLPTDYYNKE